MKELLINLEEEGIKPEYGDLKKAHFESGYETEFFGPNHETFSYIVNTI